MSDLTEIEIFDCLIGNLKSAQNDCESLAKFPMKGAAYRRLRDSLKLVEGSARQVAMWREDARWLQLGQLAEWCHQKVREWVERHEGHRSYLFMGTKLQQWVVLVEQLRHAKTERLGAILPVPQEGELRETRPVAVGDISGFKDAEPVKMPGGNDRVPTEPDLPEKRSPGGIILPGEGYPV